MFTWITLTLLFLMIGVWGSILLNAFDVTFHISETIIAIEEFFQ